MENKKQDTMLRFRKKPRRKLIGGLILLVVLSGLYAACLMVFNIAATALSGMETKSFQLKTLSKSLEKAYSMQTSVYEDIMNRHELKVLLEAASCSGLISEGIDLSPCMYQDGAIISISDGSVEYPPDFPDGIRIGESPLEDPAGMCISSGEGEDGGPSAVYYARIEGPLFYIDRRSRKGR